MNCVPGKAPPGLKFVPLLGKAGRTSAGLNDPPGATGTPGVMVPGLVIVPGLNDEGGVMVVPVGAEPGVGKTVAGGGIVVRGEGGVADGYVPLG